MEIISELSAELKQSFYNFASSFFQNLEIEDACLSLYEKYKVNANMLMLCCWLAKENYQRLSKEQINLIVNRIDCWCEKVLQPLINLSYRVFPFRQTMRFSQTFQVIQDCVNNAAQVERSLMLEILKYLEKQDGPEVSNMNFALGNIFRYLETLQISIHKNDLEKIYRITSNAI